MWQVMAAGWDGVSPDGFPNGSVTCNCFGHEISIAEYVMQSVFHWQRPMIDAFERMKNNDWYYHTPASFPDVREAYGKTLGILGFGMIGKEVANRAKAFGMKVLVCNRSVVETGDGVDAYYPIDQVAEFAAEVDFLSISVHLAEATANIIDAALLNGMKKDAVIINVGRAGLIDEHAIFDALKEKCIRGAILDPQYNYPTAENPNAKPTNLDFTTLDNALLTSHMSGVSDRLLARRAEFVANNIMRLVRGDKPENIVWTANPKY
jgi:phosphoglycerate dehydrogenase-like enzyme